MNRNQFMNDSLVKRNCCYCYVPVNILQFCIIGWAFNQHCNAKYDKIFCYSIMNYLAHTADYFGCGLVSITCLCFWLQHLVYFPELSDCVYLQSTLQYLNDAHFLLLSWLKYIHGTYIIWHWCSSTDLSRLGRIDAARLQLNSILLTDF